MPRLPVIPDLTDRDKSVRERMDALLCDADALEKTYAKFHHVNRVVAGWRTVYRRDIRPRALRRRQRVLDIGAGGGDVARSLMRWAQRDQLPLEVVGVDLDQRAVDWARGETQVDGLTFRCATSRELADSGERFEIVISNHLLHHLQEPEIEQLLADSERLLTVGGLAVHSDILRHRLAYAAFALGTLPFRSNVFAGSFIREDGLTSIRRSFTRAELEAVAPAGWIVCTRAPFRLHLRLEPEHAQA